MPQIQGYEIKIAREVSPKQFYAPNDVTGTSPQSVHSFIDYISDLDSKYLFDGVVLVGDYPTPYPVYANEPTVKVVKELSGNHQQRTCSPSRDQVFVEKKEAEVLEEAIIRDTYVKSAIYNQDMSGVDEGLLSKINNDYEMSLAVRRRHPLFNNDKTRRHVPDSFWISRYEFHENPFLVPIKDDKPIWILDKTGKSILTFSGKKILENAGLANQRAESSRIERGRSTTYPLQKPFLIHDNDDAYTPIALGIGRSLLIEDKQAANVLQGDVVIVATANYENLQTDYRYKNRDLQIFGGQTLMTSPPSNSASWDKMRSSFVSHAHHKYRAGEGSGNVIFPTGYVSQKLIHEIIKVISEQKYKTLGDFYLALQKEIHKKKSANELDNLIFFGNGASPMPILDLSEFNFDVLADIFPEESGNERSSQMQFDREYNNHQSDEERLAERNAELEKNTLINSWSYYWPQLMQRAASLASFWYISKSKQIRF